MATSMRSRCVFLGAPGAGKGTQAKRAANYFAGRGDPVAHLSTGDMLREEVKSGSSLGQQAKGFMDGGQLVPDQLIIDLVKDRIQQPDARFAWILDGFPRTLPQAEALDEKLSGDQALTRVISFAIPEGQLIGRLSGRRTCSRCGAIWHIENRPTRVAGVCDSCGAELIQRSDDRPEAIGKRLDVYRSQTAPLLAYYGACGVLREIDADRSPDVVFQELLERMQ